MPGADAFALVNVEYVVVSEAGNFFLFVGLFVFLLYPFPEDNHAGFFALLDLSASLLALLEGQVFAGAAQHELVQKAVGLAGCVADSFAVGNPGFLPGDDALFYGWLLGFGKRVKLTYPDDAVEGFKAYLDKVRAIYE